MAAFVAIERRVSEPMLPLGLFRRRAFTGVQLAAFAVSGSMFALFLYLTLYLQNYLGYSPFDAGLRYLPITIASFLVAPVAGVAAGPRAGALHARRRAGDDRRRAAGDGRARARGRSGRRCCSASSSPG